MYVYPLLILSFYDHLHLQAETTSESDTTPPIQDKPTNVEESDSSEGISDAEAEEEVSEEEDEKSLDGVSPGLCCVREKNDDWSSPELCCVQIRHLIGMRYDILRSEPSGVDIVHHYFS